MRNGNERKSLSSSPLDWEVGLGLKMQLQQPTASYSCDGGGGGGGGPFFNGSNNQPHIFELANGVLVQRNLDNAAASRASPGGGLMGVCGKALFTSSQLQELERQKMINKYIMTSIPVPPQLLLLSTTPPPSSLSQSNTSGLDLRYSTSSSTSNGSDPEPWRCKRTDGKKWRCSRDVAPDLKYCERHAHKNRPRSRKHVEISLPTTHKPNSSLLIPPSSTLSRSSSSQFPYHQTRCIEWLMRGGSGGDDATNKQQWGQGQLNDDLSVNNVYRPHFADKQGFINSSNADTTQAAAAATATTTTRLFIDAWGKEGISGQGSSLEKKLTWPSSSLSLSMGEGGGDEKGTDLGGIHQWLNPNCWMNSSSSSSSAPGGPLGEALCLGNGNYSTNLASPHAGSSHGYSYSYSNSNTNSSSKSSCEDANHALNFIG